MRDKTTNLAIILSVLLLGSCTHTTAPSIDNTGGAFRGTLIMYDSTGSKLVEGRIFLSRTDSTDIAGSWSLNEGRQGGRLTGWIADSTISVNLNPDLVDANTYLIGTYRGATIEGRWFFSGIAGPIDHGTFVVASD